MTRPRMIDLTKAAARQSGLFLGELYQDTRAHHIAHPRQLAMYFCLKAGYSMPQIGRHFGVHHTTVLHARRAVEKRIAERVAAAKVRYSRCPTCGGPVSRETNGKEAVQ